MTIEKKVGNNANIESLLKRVNMFLEDGDWDKADEYCERVLDIDPECAEAYLGKLMVDLNVKNRNELKEQQDIFCENNNYKKAISFADKELKDELIGFAEFVTKRKELSILIDNYNCAKNSMSLAKTEKDYIDLANQFMLIGDFQDSAELAKQCNAYAEIARKDEILDNAKSIMDSDFLPNYESAIKHFESIPGWKDADIKANECRRKLELQKAKAEEKQKEIEVRASNRKMFIKIAIPILFCIALVVVLYSSVIGPRLEMNSRYNDAVAVMDSGRYTLAISLFENLDGYKDSEEKIEECNNANNAMKYDEAIELMTSGNYEDAIEIFKSINGYKDSNERLTECNDNLVDIKYNEAVELLECKNYVEAYEVFISLDGYLDSAEKAESIYEEYELGKLQLANIGDCIFWGLYEQDNNIANGKEDIEWLVIDKSDGNILVISKYALDCKQYAKSYSNVSWETSSIRKWLNSDFINSSFSEKEQSMILESVLLSGANPEYDTNPGNPTRDRVFILSINDADRYFISDNERQCQNTTFANANCIDSCLGWWLRSPGEYDYFAAYVGAAGDIAESGYYVDSARMAVRPAMWIDLNF